ILAYRFAMRTAQDTGKQFEGIDPQAMAMLQAAPWNGNVRELQHAVERAIILSPNPILTPSALDGERFGLTMGLNSTGSHLSMAAGAAAAAAAGLDADAIVLHTLNVAEAEGVLIERALERSGQNRTRAAELLGISVRTLRNKLNSPS